MARYPRELCRAILHGVSAQLKVVGRLLDGCYGVQVADRDGMAGPTLKDALVRVARKQEFEFVAKIPLWIKVPKKKSFDRTGRSPISARWMDVNKADEQDPNYRSRYVAHQFKALDRSGACYFAPAPPLEAMRTVLSMSMTR